MLGAGACCSWQRYKTLPESHTSRDGKDGLLSYMMNEQGMHTDTPKMKPPTQGRGKMVGAE